MEETSVVHVHRIDEESVVLEHLSRDFVLKDKSDPSIITQGGFFKLTFVKDPVEAAKVRATNNQEAQTPASKTSQPKQNWKRLFSFR